MTVNAKGAVESRPVETSGVQGQNWIVTNGLKAGDKVIVDGVAKVKEGQEVSAKPYQAQPATPQGSAPNATKPAQSGKPQAEQKASNA
ncbi:Multidrug efflux pump subunit AcrA precursor [compost metagenome]